MESDAARCACRDSAEPSDGLGCVRPSRAASATLFSSHGNRRTIYSMAKRSESILDVLAAFGGEDDRPRSVRLIWPAALYLLSQLTFVPSCGALQPGRQLCKVDTAPSCVASDMVCLRASSASSADDKMLRRACSSRPLARLLAKRPHNARTERPPPTRARSMGRSAATLSDGGRPTQSGLYEPLPLPRPRLGEPFVAESDNYPGKGVPARYFQSVSKILSFELTPCSLKSDDGARL